MLIDTMTPKELYSEIFQDWDMLIISPDFEKIGLEYDEARMHGNISNDSIHALAYELETKKKNKWVFILSKAPAEKYNGFKSISLLAYTYYRTEMGLRVFKIAVESRCLYVYNGHLFSRYNERMGLGLTSQLEMIKHFFINNGYGVGQLIEKNGKDFVLSVCKDGLLLGELQLQRTWWVNKTFITKDQKKWDQDKVERELIESLQDDIQSEINKENFDNSRYDYLSDVIEGIKG